MLLRKRESQPVEKQSLRVTFFVTSMVLVVITGWAIWDEAKTRRPWKEYQLDFNRREYQMVADHLAAARAAFERPEVQAEYRKLLEELKKAEAVGSSPAYREAEEGLRGVKATLLEVQTQIQFIKSELDEARYWVEKAVFEGRDTHGPEAVVGTIEARLTPLERREAELSRRVEELEGRIRTLTRPGEGIRVKIAALQEPVVALERRLEAIRTRSLEVRQVVVEGLDRNEFKEAILRVDRCITCHMAADRAGFEAFPEPFRTHPFRELVFGKHPLSRFGCTGCHQGQGPALDIRVPLQAEKDDAHGYSKHWEKPMLRGEMMQATCRGCHIEQKAIPLAPVLTAGRRLVEERGCFGCHNIPGFDKMEKVGPDLTSIRSKVGAGWLLQWIKNPRSYLPYTRMPNFKLSDEDALAIGAYLWSASAPFSLETYRPGASVERGQQIIASVGCLGCHRIEGLSRPRAEPLRVSASPTGTFGFPSPTESDMFGPDLSRIGTKVSAEWLYNWVKNPKRFRPPTRMPSLRLSDEEARAVTAFLMTLGSSSAPAGVEAALRDPENAKKGETLIRKRGCFGCHDIKGFETADKIAPDLTNFGTKRLLELFFGEAVEVKQTWEDWTYNKLKNPQVYATKLAPQIMPDFGFEHEQIIALRVFLKSLTAQEVTLAFRRSLTETERAIQNGRTAVRRYNCDGCHVMEGQGGAIAAYYPQKAEAPPPLEVGALHEGEKVQSGWLFEFLGRPTTLRPWLTVRMPTFGLRLEEGTALAHYFAALAGVPFPYEYVHIRETSPESARAGRLLFSKEYFDCGTCHQQGERKPEGPPEGWAPDLALAHRRLRPEWIAKWLKDPQKIQPGTKMPSFFPGGPDNILGGSDEKQIQALADYLMSLGGQ